MALVAVVSTGLNQLAPAVMIAANPRMKPLAERICEMNLKGLDAGGSEGFSSAMVPMTPVRVEKC